MNTKALASLADLICRAQENGKRTPMGIAMAIESAGRHMSPEAMVEMHDLRTRMAAMANPPRELYLAQYEGVEPELFTTVEAAREYCDDVAPSDAHGKCWDWTVNEFGIHVQFWTHPDDDRPMSDTSGYVTPIVVQGDEPLSELERLRARVAELEAELRIGAPWKCPTCSKDNNRDVCVICETDRPESEEEAAQSADKLTRRFAPTPALREADRVVAYRNPDRPGVLLCRPHGDGWWGLTPLTSEDLPDGGVCTYGDPADPSTQCGADVLITPPHTETGEGR
ncbi:hypothetical protein [Streptomyces sp. NPDC001635]